MQNLETWKRTAYTLGAAAGVALILFVAFRAPPEIGEGDSADSGFGSGENAGGDPFAMGSDDLGDAFGDEPGYAVPREEENRENAPATEAELREPQDDALNLEGLTLSTWKDVQEPDTDETVEATPPPTGRAAGGHGQAGSGASGGGRPLGTGDISFRIHWRPPVDDIDLHVIDPHGHEIWYGSKTCPCGGQLDRDDQHGGGPENIFWPDGKSPKGQFRYYAVYYRGSGPREVLIEVREQGVIIHRELFTLQRVKQKSEIFVHDHR